MNIPNRNQHYVSQVLLRRFIDDTGVLQRFCLKSNTWNQKSPKAVFSRIGYNQVIINGVHDDSLEESFTRLEDKLPEVLKALDTVANGGSTRLEEAVYNNLMWYCAYLWNMSPFAKATAPMHFLLQLDSDLKFGRTDLLKAMAIPERDFKSILDLHSKGQKFILQGGDYLQVIFRIVFNNKCPWEFDALSRIKWKVYHSPIEVPVPDVVFLKFYDKPQQAHVHVFPLAPKLVLIGSVKSHVQLLKRAETTIERDTLTQDEADYIVQAICLSGITAIASNTRAHDIRMLRQLAEQRGISFAKIKDLNAILTAGTKEMKGNLMLMPVTNEQYKSYMNSFVDNSGVKL